MPSLVTTRDSRHAGVNVSALDLVNSEEWYGLGPLRDRLQKAPSVGRVPPPPRPASDAAARPHRRGVPARGGAGEDGLGLGARRDRALVRAPAGGGRPATAQGPRQRRLRP